MKTLYPGLTIERAGDHWMLQLKVMVDGSPALSSWELTRSMPQAQAAVNAWCEKAQEPMDQTAQITALQTQVAIMQSDLAAKQMIIDNMNKNFASLEKVIDALRAELAKKKTSWRWW